jgi:hypothetical protein
VGRYRIVPSGVDRWAVQQKRWLMWSTLWSSFRNAKDAEAYITERLTEEAEEFMRLERIAQRRACIAPREFP